MTAIDFSTIAQQAIALTAGAIGGGLLGAIAAIVIAVRQKKPMQDQIDAMKGQLDASNRQVKASIAAAARSAHLELIKMTIADESVAKVWGPKETEKLAAFKQHLFVNAHLSHLEMLHALGELSDDQITTQLSTHSQNDYYRIFWKGAASHRQAMAKDGASLVFFNLCAKAFAEPVHS